MTSTPEPERRAVQHGDTSIEYTVVRSRKRRRTIGITVKAVGDRSQEPGDDGYLRGAVVVRAPLRASRAMVAEVVQRKAGWIARKLDEITRRRGQTPARPGGGAEEEMGPEVEAWHRARAQEVLEAAVGRWAAKVGGSPTRVLIRNQKRLWGSCARDGTLRFNWRLALLPPALIDYVVVHELTHLRVRSHAREFWSAVAQVLPDFRERRARLREVRLL